MGEPHLSLALYFLSDIYQETAPLSTLNVVLPERRMTRTDAAKSEGLSAG